MLKLIAIILNVFNLSSSEVKILSESGENMPFAIIEYKDGERDICDQYGKFELKDNYDYYTVRYPGYVEKKVYENKHTIRLTPRKLPNFQ